MHIDDSNKISLYIHYPYCVKKCPYCDFNSYVSNTHNSQNCWRDAYLSSLGTYSKYLQGKIIKSIFFGGGTPSLMDPATVESIIEFCTKHNNKQDNIQYNISEITLEANPSSFEVNKFKDLKIAGVNRISIGIQSFSDNNLEFLGRNHNSKDAIYALEQVSQVFERFSFDLIMGLPNQSLANWKQDVLIAKNFIKDHISIYQLTIEPNTTFYRNNIATAEEEDMYAMYMFNIDFLEKLQIYQYEISNFASLGQESIHNLNYWLGGEFLGIGPGAHSRVLYNNVWYALMEIKNPNQWLSCNMKNQSTCKESEVLSFNERIKEIILTIFRLSLPIPKDIVKIIKSKIIDNLLNMRLLELKKDNNLYVSKEGKVVLDYVLREILIEGLEIF